MSDRERPDVTELSFTEQLSEQLGGVRGLAESSVPIAVFVVVNVLWSLNPALLVALGVALVIAVYRLTRREPIRHAVNGVIGVVIGAVIAWRTGEARDFYLPGILYNFGYAAVLTITVLARYPAIGWVWSVVAAGGKQEWRRHPRLIRVFGWLTLLWAAWFLVKGLVQGALWWVNEATWLGVARLAMGLPPFLVLIAITAWVVRRAAPSQDQSTEAQIAS